MLPPNFSLTHQRRDPFLWFHVATIAAVPLTLVLSMLGLAVGDPVFPGWLEILLLGLPPIALSVWLQYSQPIFPYSLWLKHRPADKLEDMQLRVLSLSKSYASGWVAIVVGVFLYVVFRQLYITAPLASAMTFLPAALRLVGVLWALVFFTVSAFLLQVGIAAARILVMPATEFMAAPPFDPADVAKGFLVLGQRSPQLFESALVALPGERQMESTTVELLEPPYGDAQATTTTPTAAAPEPDRNEVTKKPSPIVVIKQKLDQTLGQLLADEGPISQLVAKVVTLIPGQGKAKPAPTPEEREIKAEPETTAANQTAEPTDVEQGEQPATSPAATVPGNEWDELDDLLTESTPEVADSQTEVIDPIETEAEPESNISEHEAESIAPANPAQEDEANDLDDSTNWVDEETTSEVEVAIADEVDPQEAPTPIAAEEESIEPEPAEIELESSESVEQTAEPDIEDSSTLASEPSAEAAPAMGEIVTADEPEPVPETESVEPIEPDPVSDVESDVEPTATTNLDAEIESEPELAETSQAEAELPAAEPDPVEPIGTEDEPSDQVTETAEADDAEPESDSETISPDTVLKRPNPPQP
jgi:hypothetical protein